jgi:flagellin
MLYSYWQVRQDDWFADYCDQSFWSNIMTVINTNVNSIMAQNALSQNSRVMGKTMEQLSTGKRINSASDDAAGLAISEKMTSQLRGLNQAVRNTNDAISLVQTAEGALVEVTGMMQRMRELAVQASSDTNSTTDRAALNDEFTALRTEINRVAANTQFNGSNILDKSAATSTGVYKFQVGANDSQTVSFTIGNYATTSSSTQGTQAAVVTTTSGSGPNHTTPAAQVSTLTLTGTPALGDVITATVGDQSFVHTVTAGAATIQTVTEIAAAIQTGLGTISGVGIGASSGVLTFTASSSAYGSNSFEIGTSQIGLLGGINSSSVTSQSGATSAISALDTAISTVNTGRSGMGAVINRLEFAGANLENVAANTAASRSRVLDTDYAKTTTELARAQIIQQAATAMLAQANQQPASVLSLLQ